MCVIISKEKSARIPTIEELKNCFERNSDGAGFMYVNNNKVVIDKGYMSYKSFKKHFYKLCKKFDNFKNKSLVIHCRIGTAGANNPENCHPYAVVNNADDLHKQYFCSDLGVVHNGIITEYNPPITQKDTNDTQEFIKKYLTPLKENYHGFYKNKYILSGIEDITRSKFVFLDNEDNLYYVGDFVEHDGVKYSNESYKKIDYASAFKNWDNYSIFKNNDANENEVIKEYNPDDYYGDDKTADDLNYTIIKIAKGWFIETASGDWWTNKEDNLYYDPEKMQILKKLDNQDYQIIINNGYVFDENYEEVF